jgi:hypothetical protein
MAGSGSFVVVWHSYDDWNLDQYAAAGQRFDSQGNPSGGELTVVGPTLTNIPERNPAVAVANDGSHLTLWNAEVSFQFNVYGQVYDDQGVSQGSSFQVNTCLSHFKDRAAAAAGTDRFVVAWQSYDQDGDHYGIYVKRFDGQGVPLAVGE